MRRLPLRPAYGALILLGCGLLAFVGSFADAARQQARRAEGRAASAALVERLGLTDLALFTEARYTRHPSQADLHSAFQDHPLGLEHFPSGSLIGSPWEKIDSVPQAQALVP